MIRRFGIALAVMLMLSGVALAQGKDKERVKLPKLSYVGTMRHNRVQSFNGQMLQFCQAEWESWNRRYERCQQMATVPELGLSQGAVIETIVYDKGRYERVNGAPTWTKTRNSRYDKNLNINQGNFTLTTDAALSNLGNSEVNGVPATQYQYWILNKPVNDENGGQAVYDLFISNVADQTFVLKDQFTGRGTHEGLGEGDLTDAFIYYDINTPITVTPPPVDQVKE